LTTVLILIGVVTIASISAFVYLSYMLPGCDSGSGKGSTTGAVVLADYLSVPSGDSYDSGSRNWQFTIGDLGRVGVKSVCATLAIGAGTVTQTALGVPPDGSTAAGGAIVGGVQPGRSYPASITVVYDNGDSQLLRSSAQAIAIATSLDTVRVSMLNESLYLPSANGTGTTDAFWTYTVGNTGAVTVNSINPTFGFAPSNELAPSVLNNLVPGDEKSTGLGLLLTAFDIRAGETYSITFLVGYANGQTENISTSVTAEAV